jgi:hypothetical protein
MKYMLLIYLDEQALSETERQECYVESTQLAQQIHSSGKYLVANPLQPTSMATSVRVRNGKRLVTDGPFAETREQLGGYFLIEANNLDEAIGIAARIPMARKGTVEVRPVIDIRACRRSSHGRVVGVRRQTQTCRVRQGCCRLWALSNDYPISMEVSS